MGKKLLMYRANLIFSVGILAVLWLFVIQYSGVKEGYSDIFYIAMILAPMILIVIPKNNIKIDLAFAIITVLLIALCAAVFWKYKNGFLFNTISEEARGYFSFENELKFNLLFIWSSLSILVSLIVRFVYLKFIAAKK